MKQDFNTNTNININIDIKYHFNSPELEKIDKGDWIDLYANRMKLPTDAVYLDQLHYQKGDIVQVAYDIAMKIPEGFEVLIAPRSSTFKNTGLILTNSPSVIDNSYSGTNDIWYGMFYATRDGFIEKGQRLTHFRIIQNQPTIEFTAQDELNSENRGGYGTTGK